MPSPIEKANPGIANPNRRADFKPVTAETFALALLIATSLQIMENLVPHIPLFPWMRIGLSYVIILPFLFEYGSATAFMLLLARNVIAILYGGQPFSTFLIGTGAGALALLGVGSVVRWASRRQLLGILGASVILATAFNLSQLALVKWLLIRHAGFYFMVGPMLAWSLFSGALVAALVHYSESDLVRMFTMKGTEPQARRALTSATSWHPFKNLRFVFGLAALVGLLLGSFLWIQIPALAVLLWLSPDKGKRLGAAWPFFFYIGYLHLLHTPGEYFFKEWVTYEGLSQFAVHSLRLANTILLGRMLAKKFPWTLAENSKSPYLQGFLLSLPLLTNMFESSMEFGRVIGRQLMKGQLRGLLTPAFDAWRVRMEEGVRDTLKKED